MAKAVVNRLEPVEVDEQHRRQLSRHRLGKQFVGFGTEMKAVGKRSHRIVHAERMRILDRRAHFREQRVDRGGDFGHDLAHDPRRGRGEVAMLDRKQAIAKRIQRARILAVGTLRRDIADQKAECARHDRGENLGVELGDVEEGDERKQERGDPRGP